MKTRKLRTHLGFLEGFEVGRQIIADAFGRARQRDSAHQQYKEDDVREERREPNNLPMLEICIFLLAIIFKAKIENANNNLFLWNRRSFQIDGLQ